MLLAGSLACALAVTTATTAWAVQAPGAAGDHSNTRVAPGAWRPSGRALRGPG